MLSECQFVALFSIKKNNNKKLNHDFDIEAKDTEKGL